MNYDFEDNASNCYPPDFPSAELDRWLTTEPDEENPNYRTEFDERVSALAEADIRERSLEPEEDRLRRLEAKLQKWQAESLERELVTHGK